MTKAYQDNFDTLLLIWEDSIQMTLFINLC